VGGSRVGRKIVATTEIMGPSGHTNPVSQYTASLLNQYNFHFHPVLSALHTLSKTERFYCVTSYLKVTLSKLRSFDRQQRRSQNCPFQSSFTQRTTQGIPQFPQFTCRHHHGIISRHSTELTKKTDKPDRKPVRCHGTFSFSCSFLDG
jgi:hypothetical protein